MAPAASTAATVAIKVYGGTSTSSPAPMSSWMSDVINALVPLTKVRQRLAPTVSAHFASNSLTIPALDQTPLLNTSNTRFSSVSGFQIGHSLHPPLWIGSPPSMAGRPALGLANRLGAAPSANIE